MENERLELGVAGGNTPWKKMLVKNTSAADYDLLRNVYGLETDPVQGDTVIHSTIASAQAAARAGLGDEIILSPGYAESVTAANGVNLTKSGLHLRGLGRGALRPTFTFSGAITAEMQVGAASITLENIMLVNGIDNLTNALNIAAPDCTLIDVETRDNDSNFHCDDFIVTTADADRLKIKGWTHRAAVGAAGAQTAISIVGGDDIEIDFFDVDGAFATACIENVTTAATNLKVGARSYGNLARTRNAADVIFTAVATTTGFVNNIFSRLQDNAANITEAFVGADMQFGPNLPIVNSDGEQALQWNGTASTDV